MGRKNIQRILGSLIIIIGSTAKAYEAHEWGTFTSMVGSDGTTVEGMYHEDEKLPDFVHGFGVTQGDLVTRPTPPDVPDYCDRPGGPFKGCFAMETLQANRITQKMETPVIYFYSDKQVKVDVDVQFPNGVITETFPAPVQTFPAKGATELKNGRTKFSVTVDPSEIADLPYVSPTNIYGHARKVASAKVRSRTEVEKFIFYRGLGRFQPRFQIAARDGIHIQGTVSMLPQAAFLVHVDSNGLTHSLDVKQEPGNFGYDISPDRINALKAHKGGAGIMDAQQTYSMLISALIQAGLRSDEASAMLETWKHGYLKVPGLRLLYILPRSEVDAVLPITFNPAPEKLERVFVGRLEILTHEEEQRLLDVVLVPGFKVETLGRFAESILRRLEKVYRRDHGPFIPHEIAKRFDSLIEEAAKSEIITSGTVH